MEAEPELLTLDMVRKLINQGLAQQKAENAKQLEKQLAQQKAHYEDLLNKQADTFTKLVRVMMDSTNDRFDSAVNISHELKTSLHFTQNEVDELKKTTSKLATDSELLEKNQKIVCDSLKILDRTTDYLENQSRRNNLVFDGIKEMPKETWATTEEKVCSVISNCLKLDTRDMAIERAHRVGKPDTNSTKPRPIVVKFLNHKDRANILENAKKLKNTGIFINEDFSAQVREKRKALLPQMRAAREKGDIAYLRYDQLIVHPPRSKNGPTSPSVTSTPK